MIFEYRNITNSWLQILFILNCQLRPLHSEPNLQFNKSPIPVVAEAKFLGLVFNRKPTFIPHKKCLKALNLLKVVAHTDWGADTNTLLKLCCSLVCSKLGYECIVYGSA